MLFLEPELMSKMKRINRNQEIVNATLLFEDSKGAVNMSKINCRFSNLRKQFGLKAANKNVAYLIVSISVLSSVVKTQFRVGAVNELFSKLIQVNFPKLNLLSQY